ncbi:MAG TPA: LysR substrate-binding domain-containing protein [Paraburkholderia sp.]|jgi:LysR family glycine cleavage system transcriptional activator
MRRLPPLNALRAFEAVARQGTLTRAADELHVTPTAVSKHLKNLEDTLNIPLFERDGGLLSLTTHGKRYARALGRAFEMIGEATDLLSEASIRTQVTLRAYTTLLVRWLIPRIPAFQQQHPEIELRLTTAFDAVDFERDDVDLGVRYGRGHWPGLQATLLFNDELVAIGNTAMRDRFAEQPLTEALASTTLLVHTLHLDDWPDWLEQAGLADFIPSSRIPLDDMSLIYQSALDGLGVGMMQRLYLADDLAEGRLHLLSPVVLRRDRGFYLVYKPETALNPGVQAFLAWIESQRAG